MSEPEDTAEGPLYEPLVWSLSAVLLTSGLVLLILMWTHVIGPFRFTLLPEGQAGRGVGLWIPDQTGTAISPETSRRLGRWRGALAGERPVFASPRLDELLRQGAGIVVVPDARPLRPEHAARLWRFAAEGGAAVLVGGIGVRGADGAWRGWTLMERLLSEKRILTLPAEGAGALQAWRRGPLSAGLRPREAVPLAAEPGVPALPSETAELRWEGPPGSPARGAAKRIQVGRGRVVWLAAGPEASRVELGEPWQPMARLVRACLAWSLAEPYLEVLAWPDAARFAVAPRAGQEPLASGRARHAVLTRAALTGEALGWHPRDLASSEVAAWQPWRAGAGQLDEWRSLRDDLAVALERAGPRRWLVKVTNLGDTEIRDAVLRAHWNRPVATARAEATEVLDPVPDLRFRRGGERLDLWLPPLAAGESRAYGLEVESASGTRNPEGVRAQAQAAGAGP